MSGSLLDGAPLPPAAPRRGKCPIPGCGFLFRAGHNGIDAHVRGKRHDGEFPGIPLAERYAAFLDRYPPERWPTVAGRGPVQGQFLELDATEDGGRPEAQEAAYREQLVEQLFLTELLQEAWLGRRMRLDVLAPAIDASGYDWVLEWGTVVRHLQLKITRRHSQTTEQRVNLRLASRPAGCVIWVIVDEDPLANRYQLTYRFFGRGPGEPLVFAPHHQLARATKGDVQGARALRSGLRHVPGPEFVEVRGGMGELLTRLFGRPAAGSSPED